jgi:hypothetical protein
MRSLAGIRARLDELLTAHEGEDQPPSAVVLLPENFRGPASDAPYPRIERVGQAAVVTYLVSAGQPSAADIARMVRS